MSERGLNTNKYSVKMSVFYIWKFKNYCLSGRDFNKIDKIASSVKHNVNLLLLLLLV